MATKHTGYFGPSVLTSVSAFYSVLPILDPLDPLELLLGPVPVTLDLIPMGGTRGTNATPAKHT